jgi:hypothetical protein
MHGLLPQTTPLTMMGVMVLPDSVCLWLGDETLTVLKTCRLEIFTLSRYRLPRFWRVQCLEHLR